MKHPLKVLLPLVIVAGSWHAEASAFLMRGSVIGNGATPAAGSANGSHVLLGTAGQTIVGESVNGDNFLRHGYWSFGGSRVVAVQDPPLGGDLPKELSLSRPTPNPSLGGVRFALALPKSARVSLVIFDVGGRQVHRSDAGEMSAGYHTLRWEGSNASGQAVGSGVFFARLLVDGRLVASRRLVRVH